MSSSAIVVEAYQSTRDSELTINVGDAVEIKNKYDNGWWLGETGGKLGLFPSKCVTAATMESASSASSSTTPSETPKEGGDEGATKEKRFTYPHSSRSERAIVVHSFVGESASELTLKEGEEVNVLDKTDEWWVGEKGGIVGHFPPSFVKLLPKSTSENDVKSDEAEATAPKTVDSQDTTPTPSSTPAQPSEAVVPSQDSAEKKEVETPKDIAPQPVEQKEKDVAVTPVEPTTSTEAAKPTATTEATTEATPTPASTSEPSASAPTPSTSNTSSSTASPTAPGSPTSSTSPPAARLDTPFYITTTPHSSESSQAIPISPTAASIPTTNGQPKPSAFTPAIAPSRDVPPGRPFGSPPDIRVGAFKLTRAATANQLGKSPIIGSRRPPSPPATAPPPTRTTSLFTMPPRKPTTACPAKPAAQTATIEPTPTPASTTTAPTTTSEPTTTPTATTVPTPSTTPPPQTPRESLVAVWDYEPETEAELGFKAGDVILVYKTEDEGEWWQGELNGKVGHFPKSYVRSPTETPEPSSSASESSLQIQQIGTIAQVLYDYKPLTDTELPLTKGDEVVVLEKQMKGGWSKVSHNGRVGHVPSTYLNFTDEVYPPTKLTSIGKGRALWSFESKSDSELSFNKGDEISILKRLDGSWWLGEVNGVVGHFPKTYIQEGDSVEPSATEKEPQPSPRQQPSASVSEKSAPSVTAAATAEAISLAQITALIEKATQPLLQEIAKLNESLATERKAREELQEEVTKLREKQTIPASTSTSTSEAILLSPRAGDSDTASGVWRRELEANFNKMSEELLQLKRKVDKLPDSSKPEVPFKPSSLRSTGSKLY